MADLSCVDVYEITVAASFTDYPDWSVDTLNFDLEITRACHLAVIDSDNMYSIQPLYGYVDG